MIFQFNLLGRVDILFLLPREALNQWKSRQKPSFEEKTRFLFSDVPVSEPIYVSLLSACDEISTEPSKKYRVSAVLIFVVPTVKLFVPQRGCASLQRSRDLIGLLF